MKHFLKTVLAVICGLFIANIIGLVLLFGFIGALSAGSSSKAPVMPKEGVLLMDMSRIGIAEQASADDPFAALSAAAQGGSVQSVGLLKAVDAIKEAQNDPAVQYIFIKSDGVSAGMAHIQELRSALKDFRSCGKPVISYIETPSTGSYYLASVADKVYMTANAGGTSMVNGISSQLIFLKDILDKLGVNVQLIRHGKYKSAGEMYIRSESSPENMEQNQQMINSIWHTFASEIAESREISEDELNALIDGLKLNFASDFLEAHLVDQLLTKEELHSKLADLAVKEKYEQVKFINFADYVASKELKVKKTVGKVAIIYADGEIVDGTQTREVAGDRFAQVISKVRKDESISAVVLRVNSPGGSVLASDKIKTELDLLHAEKPLVASYGNYAASGGYWISNACDKIYSNPATLTGSIGVFGMVPDFSKTLKNVAHINITPVNSNKHGDMYGLMRPFDAAEHAYMQASIENIYTTFVNTVAEGRKLDPEFVDSIAQGRVWTGTDALGIHLVDELGTLRDAIAYTAGLVDLDPETVAVVEFPKPQTQMEMLMEMLGEATGEPNIFAGTVLEQPSQVILDWARGFKRGSADIVFARIPYAIDIR